MKTQITTLFVCLVFMMSACSDEFLTEGEMLGKKIQQFAKSEDITRASAYLLKFDEEDAYYEHEISEVVFQVEGQVINLGSEYYNLSKLVKYQPEHSETYGKVLALYFDGYKE